MERRCTTVRISGYAAMIAAEIKCYEGLCCGTKVKALRFLLRHGVQTCWHTDEAQRTFWRGDQLVQHVRRAHGQRTLLTELERAWKSSNPALDEWYLKCGFRGCDNDTWEVRREHVVEHMLQGATKEKWWSGELSAMQWNVWSCRSLAGSLSIVLGYWAILNVLLRGSGLTEHDTDLHVEITGYEIASSVCLRTLTPLHLILSPIMVHLDA